MHPMPGVALLFGVLVAVSIAMGILSVVWGRARKRELERLDARERDLRSQGKID